MAYNVDIANSYLSKGDYDNLTRYLSKFHFIEADKQRKNQNNIMESRSRARVQNGLLSRATTNQAQALKFMNAWEGCYNLPDNRVNGNSFTTRAVDALRNLGGENATSIQYTFAPKTVRKTGIFGIDWLVKDKHYENDAFTDFENTSGMSRKYLMQNGVKLGKDASGNTVMTINKTSPLFIRAYKALNQLKDSEDGNYRFKMAGIDSKGKYIKINTEVGADAAVAQVGKEYGEFYETDGYNVMPTEKSVRDLSLGTAIVGDKGYGANSPKFSFSNLNRVISEASEQRDILIGNKDENGDEITHSLSGTFIPSLGAGYSRLYQNMQRGLVRTEQYNATRKAIEDKFSQAIAGGDLSQYEMYVTDPDVDASSSLNKVDESNDKNKYQSLIINALGTDRIHYGTYTNGQQSGTMIIINPMMKDKTDQGKTTNTDDIKTNAIKIFVPDLFKEQVDATLKSDTKYRAIKELSNAQMYKYDLSIPNDGKIRINRDDKGNTTYKFEDDTSGEIMTISQAEALNHVNKMLIQEDITDKTNSLFYNEDGQFRQDIVNEDGTIKNSFQKEISNTVNSLVTAAMSELNPQSFKNFQEVYGLVNNPKVNKDVLDKAMSSNFTTFDDYNLIVNKMQRMSAYILANIGYNSQDPDNSFNIE